MVIALSNKPRNWISPYASKFGLTILGASGMTFCIIVIYITLGNLMETRPEVFVIGTLVLFSAAVYFLIKPCFERAVILMVITLPLFSSLVFNIGGSVRITYLLTLLAAVIAISQHRPIFIFNGRTGKLLLGFFLYALISIAYTLNIPDLTPVTSSGFRGLPIRSVIQFGQLVLMLMAFSVIINYATTVERLAKLCNVLFWSLVIVVGYGLYEFFAAVFNYPFINLVTVPSYGLEVAPWAENLTRDFSGTNLPRPRSTVGEPLDFAAYILFCIPFAAVAASFAKDKVISVLKFGSIFAAGIAFIVANSRAGFVAAVGVIPFVLLFAPGHKIRLALISASVGAVLVISFVIFPLIGSDPGFEAPLRYFKENYASVLTRQGRVGSYSEALQVFQQHPILGVGIGNFPFHLPRGDRVITDTIPTTGSLYLRLLSEFGIIGTTLFLGFVASIAFGTLKVLRQSKDPHLRRFAFAALVSLLAYMITRAASVGLFTESYFWVLLAIAVSVMRLHKVGTMPQGKSQVEPSVSQEPGLAENTLINR